jgi:hypothetical protein
VYPYFCMHPTCVPATATLFPLAPICHLPAALAPLSATHSCLAHLLTSSCNAPTPHSWQVPLADRRTLIFCMAWMMVASFTQQLYTSVLSLFLLLFIMIFILRLIFVSILANNRALRTQHPVLIGPPPPTTYIISSPHRSSMPNPQRPKPQIPTTERSNL